MLGWLVTGLCHVCRCMAEPDQGPNLALAPPGMSGIISTGDIVGVLIAFALAVSLPLGKKLSRWSIHRLRATESFAAGASLAYVIIDLMVELTAIGGAYVHSRVRIRPTPGKSVFAVVLAGATWRT